MRAMFDVGMERERQDAKWGEQNHLDGTGRPGDFERAAEAKARCQAGTPETDNWRDIMDEELTETYVETDPARIRAELVQVAAVAVAWIEAIDRRVKP